MGFPAEWCFEALEQNHDDVEAAAEWLLSRSDEILKAADGTTPPPAPASVPALVPAPKPRPKGPTSSEDIGTKLRSLSPGAFEDCIALIFEHLLELLHQGKALQAFLQANTDTIIGFSKEKQGIDGENPSGGGDNEFPLASDDDGQAHVSEILEGIGGIMKSIADRGQRSIAQLLSLRKDVQARLKLTGGSGSLQSLWTVITEPADKLEAITGHKMTDLKSALLSQMKRAIEINHENQMTLLVSTLDGEEWRQATVSDRRQKSIKAICSGVNVSSTFVSDYGKKGAGERGQKFLLIEKIKYCVVWSALLLMEMVQEYLSCAMQYPSVATDIVKRLTELLHLFHTRTHSQVLGAGAMQTARLQSISCRHLALASQSLSLVTMALPHIRTALSKLLLPRQQLLLVDLDRVSEEFTGHRSKIMGKFVNIAGELMEESYKLVHQIEWDFLPGKEPSKITLRVAESLAALAKQILILPREQVEEVFSRIFGTFGRKGLDFFDDVQPATTKGKERLVDDIAYLVDKLKAMQPGADSAPLQDLLFKIKQKYATK